MTLRKILPLLCLAVTLRAEDSPANKLADLPDFIKAQLALWKTPGVSVAVIQGTNVLLLEGFGLRDIKDNLPMTANTVQPVASVSKSFTVAAFGTLVRDGKASWDTPVREYLPEFRMMDEYATDHVTARHLVTHSTGLPRHDTIWLDPGVSRAELVRRLRFLEPSAPLGAKYQYNNLAYTTAGHIAGKIAGSTWEDLVRQNIFEPLGMKTASFRVEDLLKLEDHGTGYRIDDDENPLWLRYRNVDQLGPAGAINASAADMSRYLLMLVNRGKIDDRVILAPNDLSDMTSPKMIIPEGLGYREFGSSSYGMGFRITTYRGRKLVNHSGALRGLASLLSFLPDEKIGVYVAANASGSSMPSIVTYAAFDRLLGLTPIDWSSRYRTNYLKEKTARLTSRDAGVSTKISGTAPGHTLAEYAGDYEHPAYGTFTFRENDGLLEGSYQGGRAVFEHYHYDTFRAPENDSSSRSGEKAQFVTSIDGDIESVRIQLEPTVEPIIFTRVADKSMTDPDYLNKLAGQYEVGSSRVTIRVRADNRLLYVDSSQTRELLPVRNHRFAIKDRPGYLIEFTRDESETFTQIISHTPTTSTLGKRAD